MSLAPYISDLLYNHDCVIVPNFGGFVANYKPAQINDIQHTFYPPSKSITFNKHLTNNDGLLANYIAQKENLTYPNACKRITEYVGVIHAELQANNKTTIDKVGTIRLDMNGKFLFDPDTAINHLLDSYGLNIFQRQPIAKTSIEEKITKEFKDRTAPLAAAKENKASKKWLVAAAITIPLAFFAIWIPSKYDLGADLNYANLNPFTPDAQVSYTPEKQTLDLVELDNSSSVKERVALADENNAFLNVSINQTDFVVQLKEQPTAEAVSTYVATNKQVLKYHIVGGCFSSKVNARKMVRRLKKEGFDASIIGKRKGLWTVSYSSFASRKEAVNFLAEAKSHNNKAWVLNY